MNWLSITKSALGLVTSIGVGNIVGNAVKATTPPNLNTFNKITIQVGTFVLSGMVADQANKYLNEQIDSLIQTKEKPKQASQE